MERNEYPELPKSLEKYIDLPYGGLFGDSVITKVVHEIIADPDRQFTAKYLKKITGRSIPQIKTSLETLVDLKLLVKEQIDPQRSIYEANFHSNQLVALTFLAYSAIDDREGTTCFRDALFEYCEFCKFESEIERSKRNITKITINKFSQPEDKNTKMGYSPTQKITGHGFTVNLQNPIPSPQIVKVTS
ncbi:MAG: hypothetical protein WC382_12360 [Methanoregulaceae archaeon]|jgi:hypothetical protein